MGKPTGFLEYKRETAKVLPPKVRIANFKEFRTPLNKEKQKLQGARCMACGVPFCQSGMMIGGMASGCPLHNLVPETNDLVYTGNWKQAFLRLSKTHSFPEFTSRVCPALCEAACTCNINGEPVSTKENERAIIETAYENGWVTPQIPEVRTGKSIAVIGSGPSGLAAAQQLNRRGHSVTVFERKDRVGGLLRYGIPNMKLDKAVVDRRIHLMEEEGVKFVTNVNVGKDIKAEELLKQFDRVILACGASNPRDIKVPGRDAKGIYFAVDFLGQVTKALLDSDFAALPSVVGEGRRVINNIQRSASLFLVKNIFSFLLSIVALGLPLAYPFQPLQLSLVTFATIGAPAFFLALEPNHELVRGKFMRNVLRAALPGGLTDFLLVFCTQGFGYAFDIPTDMVGTICTFVILCVGLQILWGVCIPFTPLHWAIWGSMTVAGVGGVFLLAAWAVYLRRDRLIVDRAVRMLGRMVHDATKVKYSTEGKRDGED